MPETQGPGNASSKEPNTFYHSDSNNARNTPSYNELMRSMKNKTYPASVFDTVAGSPLFKLPRGIRDMIYHFALIHCRHNQHRPNIDITKEDGIPEPAMLLASKIIRCETYEVFYYGNMFTCFVEDFHPAPVLLAERKSSLWNDQVFGIGSPEVTIDFSERRWENLVSWLHMCHRGECIGWSAPIQGTYEAEDKLSQGLFDVAVESPRYCPDMLDCVLTPMRLAMVDAHLNWARD